MNDLEKKLIDVLPAFAVNVRSLQERFHADKWWGCPLRYDGEKIVAKSHEDICNGYFGKADTYPYMPAFVLNDGGQMDRLEKYMWNAEHGLAYFNPFWREHGWYIVIVDEPVLFPDELERDIEKAYSAGGHRVLALAGCDYDGMIEKALEFAREFSGYHSTAYHALDHSDSLSDDAIWCLSDASHYNALADKSSVLDELVSRFSSQEVLYDAYSVDEDFEVFKTLNHDDFIHQPCFIGNVMLNYFIRSRMDAYSKTSHHKTMNDIWRDTPLMRQVIDYELDGGTGRYHHNRIAACMKFKHIFRTVSNLNQSMIYIHCKPFARKGGIFFDPCAGWGGRMLGAYLLGMKYVAIDANRRLVEELRALAEYMHYDAEIYYGDSSDRGCVEEAMKGRKASLAFTCPPYWNEEHYSDDEFQSDVKCHGKNDWHVNFFKPMVYNMFDVLEDDGTCIISVDEKVDWGRVDGIDAVVNNGDWFNSKREDDYYVVRKKN